jgi:hypothetical protein
MASPAIISTPKVTPIPIPAFAPTPRPDDAEVLEAGEDVAEGDAVCEFDNASVDEVFAEAVDKVVDELASSVEACVLLLVLGRLLTISPVLSKKTPSPASQQFGWSSQQKLPSAQTVTRGRNPVVSSARGLATKDQNLKIPGFLL